MEPVPASPDTHVVTAEVSDIMAAKSTWMVGCRGKWRYRQHCRHHG